MRKNSSSPWNASRRKFPHSRCTFRYEIEPPNCPRYSLLPFPDFGPGVNISVLVGLVARFVQSGSRCDKHSLWTHGWFPQEFFVWNLRVQKCHLVNKYLLFHGFTRKRGIVPTVSSPTEIRTASNSLFMHLHGYLKYFRFFASGSDVTCIFDDSAETQVAHERSCKEKRERKGKGARAREKERELERARLGCGRDSTEQIKRQ